MDDRLRTIHDSRLPPLNPLHLALHPPLPLPDHIVRGIEAALFEDLSLFVALSGHFEVVCAEFFELRLLNTCLHSRNLLVAARLLLLLLHFKLKQLALGHLLFGWLLLILLLHLPVHLFEKCYSIYFNNIISIQIVIQMFDGVCGVILK